VAHQAAADHADFLFSRLAHVALTPVCFKELRCSINVIPSPVLIDQSIKGETVMPALLWVAFWSSMMATAACLGEMPKPIAPKKEDPSRAD
jgi:hypothetical protein